MNAPLLVFDRCRTLLDHALAEAWQGQGGRSVDASAGEGGLAAALGMGARSEGARSVGARSGGAPSVVVLCEPELDEAAFVNGADASPEAASAFTERLHRETMAFLSDCRTAVLSMAPAGRGRLLVLGVDDAAARILGLPETPIANHARAAALKSLAKEYGRLGLGFNTCLYHPPREMVARSGWAARRGRLRVYALRYRPVETRRYVRFLLSLLEDDTPANGGVLYLGNGVVETGA